ncbi:MAG: FadR family transcriptional regulator [Bacteroidales bacterium]|nr:FadR family transcriptional regulator [Bacteroidales bacterium]
MKKDDLSLVEQTQREILKYISQNSSKPTLPKEQEFVELLGVSRIVVREALSRLRALGIIETKRKKGTVVVVPEIFAVLKTIIASGVLDKDTLRDLYQLRLMIEIGMADFIYLNKTEEQINRLDGIVAEEVELEKEMTLAGTDTEKYSIAKKLTDIDIRFHSTLFEMTGNKSLMDFQYILRHLFTLYLPKIKTDYHSRTIVSHVSLFNLLRTGTADAFRMAMRLHLKTQFDNMEAILERTCSK